MSSQQNSTPIEVASSPMDNELQQLEVTTNVDGSKVSGSPLGVNVMDVEVNSTPQETQSQLPADIETLRRKQTSDVWNHFKRQKIDGKWKAICNYCGSKLLGELKQGTSHLRNHFKACKLRTTRDIRQAFIKTEKVGNETVVVGSYAFNQDTARRAVSKMIILHEYPMAMVDHIGFKEFCAALQPLFKVISRNTVKTDIMKIYKDEKENTMKLLSKNQSRIAITTDMWTASNQNKSYMTVTSHFIDDSWTLQSRLVRFIYVATPHPAKVLADVLLECLMDWNLDQKLSTLTVDNCSTNDAMIKRMLEKISPSLLILSGKLFHMRCCAHILNLIVKDGMSIISKAIENVRESVEYWTATPKREEKFIDTCGQVNISYVKKLVLDCKTRWNSTFLMLQVAIQYKAVFSRLAQREHQYKSLPTENEWVMAKEVCDKLEIFYEVTELFSGTLYPTTNIYFPKVCEIKLALIEWLGSPNSVIHKMAETMIEKFDKYWSDINGVMAIGVVLDPRYKFVLLDSLFPEIYGEEAVVEIAKVKSICQELVSEYDMKIKGNETVSSASNQNVVEVGEVGRKERWRSTFAKHVSSQINTTGGKSELDRYLEEPMLPDSKEFDILSWWKVNGIKYPTLQMIARDFLAIPISTVASESSFSTGGRVLTPHRSRLRSDTLEALMCVQDWLWTDMKDSSKSKVENIEFNKVVEDMDADVESSSQSGASESLMK